MPRGVEASVSVRQPFDAEALLAYLRVRAIPEVEEVSETSYSRSLRWGDRVGELHVAFDEAGGEGTVRATCSPDLEIGHRALETLVENLVDGASPVEHLVQHLASDPLLGPMVQRRPGVRVPGTVDPFELAVRAILGQQISVAGATKLASRLTSLWGGELLNASSRLSRAFPSPSVLAQAPLESIGLSRGRAAAIRHLARSVVEGHLQLEPKRDLKKTEASLLAIKGVGPWTASYIALRALRDPDAIPIGDLGLRQAAGCETTREFAELSEPWRPWRGYAAAHLWCTFLDLRA